MYALSNRYRVFFRKSLSVSTSWASGGHHRSQCSLSSRARCSGGPGIIIHPDIASWLWLLLLLFLLSRLLLLLLSGSTQFFGEAILAPPVSFGCSFEANALVVSHLGAVLAAHHISTILAFEAIFIPWLHIVLFVIVCDSVLLIRGVSLATGTADSLNWITVWGLRVVLLVRVVIILVVIITGHLAVIVCLLDNFLRSATASLCRWLYAWGVVALFSSFGLSACCRTWILFLRLLCSLLGNW